MDTGREDAAEFLEFHHIDPWARSGTHSAEGIALRCRAHNQYEARRVFGEEHMARFRKREGTKSEIPVGEGEPRPETRVLAQRELGSARQERLV